MHEFLALYLNVLWVVLLSICGSYLVLNYGRIAYRTFSRYFILQAAFKISPDSPVVLPSGEEGTITPDTCFDLSPEGLVIMDFESNILRCNKAFEQMLGFEKAVLMSRPLINFVHPDDVEQVVAVATEFRENGKDLHQFECRYVAHDEAIRYFSWTAVFRPQDNAVYAVVRDITELKQTERAMREQAEKLEEQLSLLELAHDAIIVSSMDGAITFWNHGAEVNYGWNKMQALGAKSHELLRSEFAMPMLQIKEILLERGHWTGEVTRVTRDGSRIIASCQWVVQRSAEGSPQAVLEISRDITLRRQAEVAIAQLAAIVQQSDNAIISLDLKGNVLTWNRGAENIFGYSAEQMQGCSFTKLVPAEYLVQWKETVNKTYAGYAAEPLDTVLLSSSLAQVPVLISVSPIRNMLGEPSAISLVIRDITRKKLLDKEMARLDRLNLAAQLAAGIGHEIRNPLTTVRGFLQLFGQKPELAAYAPQFELVISELDRANDIITEFLTLARNRPIEFVEASLNDCIEIILPLLKADAMIADKDIETDLGKLPRLQLSPKEVRQLIINLVRNGLEAMQPGKKLVIKTSHVKDQVILSVKDQGCGIPSEDWDKIGTPFFTTKHNGTGLGLAVCYTIAEQHGAVITFNSNELGTTFFVAFNIKR